MFSLPIVHRELLTASKGLGAWLWRWIVAVIAVVFSVFWLFVNSGAPFAMQGDVFFVIMSWSCFAYCLMAGLWTTSDALTREKADGTLGLLFLTDLRGYDVVLGKMFSGSLRSFYGVLAVLPVLALPLLMGGVTNGQFLRTVGVLLVVLIFSLSCGICFSAICRRTGQSIFWALLLLTFITFIPLVYLWTGGKNEAFSLVSPALVIFRVSAPSALPVLNWYPLWIGCGLLTSTCFLAFASWIVPKSWQDRKVSSRKETSLVSNFDNRRSTHLDSNPVSWLINRNTSMQMSRLLLICYIAFSWVAITFHSYLVGNFDEMSVFFIGMSLLWLGSLWFRIDLTRHTVSSISEARECGALEQILVTPMDERQFRRGHFRAMVRFWMWPLIGIIIAPILCLYIQVILNPELLGEGGFLVGLTFLSFFLFVLPVLGFFLDIFSLYFSGCWFALQNHSFGQAFWKTFGFVYLLPTLALSCILPYAWVITGIIFIVLPLTSLQGNFRRVVSGEYGLSHVKRPLSTDKANS